MTKAVRIENADSGLHYKVLVQVYERGYPEGDPDKLVKEVELSHPTAMTGSDIYITSTRYLVVKEA